MSANTTPAPEAGLADTCPVRSTTAESDELLVSFLRLGRALKSAHPQELEPPQSFILHILCEHDGTRLSDLAGMIRLDASTASRHVRGLEQLGYLQRATDPDDGRASRLSVTDAGRAALGRQFEANRKRIANIMRNWSDDDVASLRGYLARLTRDIELDHNESSPR